MHRTNFGVICLFVFPLRVASNSRSRCKPTAFATTCVRNIESSSRHRNESTASVQFGFSARVDVRRQRKGLSFALSPRMNFSSPGCLTASGQKKKKKSSQRLLVVPAPLLQLRLSWGKQTAGVLEVGPYRPRLRAAADFLGGLTDGNGEKTCGFADDDEEPLQKPDLGGGVEGGVGDDDDDGSGVTVETGEGDGLGAEGGEKGRRAEKCPSAPSELDESSRVIDVGSRAGGASKVGF